MDEIIVEAEPRARELFESYLEDNPEEDMSVEIIKGADGATLVRLVIENAPQISAGLAVLIATLQRRGLRFKASRDGLELAIDGPDKGS